MAATYEMREDEKGIVVVVRRTTRPGVELLWVLGFCIFFVFGYLHYHSVVWLLIAGWALGWQTIEMFRGKVVEMRLTNLEFTTRGYFGGNYIADKFVSRADVVRMEYRDRRGGGDESYEPSGLYLVRRWKTSCVLPDLDEAQTNTIIDTIYKRFPDMPLATDSEYRGIFGEPMISLGLSKPEK